MFTELKDSLQKQGVASVKLDADTTIRVARTRLIEAAKRANVRVSIKRGEYAVVATVLSAEDGEAQRVRDTIFRAANKVKQGLEILTAGTFDPNGETLSGKEERRACETIVSAAYKIGTGVATLAALRLDEINVELLDLQDIHQELQHHPADFLREGMQDEIADLRDIVQYLEETARAMLRGATD